VGHGDVATPAAAAACEGGWQAGMSAVAVQVSWRGCGGDEASAAGPLGGGSPRMAGLQFGRGCSVGEI
jgi:hypothetical protein